MRFETKYKLCLWKGYFEKGYSITNYMKYFILLFGMYSFFEKIDLRLTLFLLIFYAILCFFIGWAWFHYGFMNAEIEVSNNFNKFVREMRTHYKKRKI